MKKLTSRDHPCFDCPAQKADIDTDCVWRGRYVRNELSHQVHVPSICADWEQWRRGEWSGKRNMSAIRADPERLSMLLRSGRLAGMTAKLTRQD